jgi:hypothetical protein
VIAQLYHGDCLDIMPTFPARSVDLILSDLPYGTTQNKWDSVIPLDRLWAEYWRIAKPNAAIVLTAAQPLGPPRLRNQKRLRPQGPRRLRLRRAPDHRRALHGLRVRRRAGRALAPGQPIPPRLENHITLGGIVIAHNAQFERAIFKYVMASRYGWPDPDVEQWRCTMVMAYAMALPGALEHMGPALNTGFDKDMAGNRLMLAMSKPRRPKKGEPKDASLARRTWKTLSDSMLTAVRTLKLSEPEINALLRLRPFEQSSLASGSAINDRGVPVDATPGKEKPCYCGRSYAALDREMAEVTDWEVTPAATSTSSRPS